MVVASQLVAKVSSEGVDTTKEQLKSVGQAASETSSGFKSMLGGALSMAAGQAVFNMVGQAVGFLKNQVSDSIQMAIQHQDIMEQTAKVLKSTGDASGMTQQSLEALAASLEKTTFFSKDQTEAGENLLLTFTGIGKDVFPQATKTMLDMSKAMGGDMKSTAIELGKALNDPAQGLTALTRVGVTFTDQQKQQIQQMVAAGNVAGAQKIMLQELQREFGGSADATGSFGGKLVILQNRLGDLKERIGTALLPALSGLTDFVSSKAMPALGKMSDWFTSTAGPALQSFGSEIEKSLGKIHIGNIGGEALAGLKELGSLLNKEFGPALQNIGNLLKGELGHELHDLGQNAKDVGNWFKSSVVPALKDAAPGFESLGKTILTTVIPAAIQIRGVLVDVVEHALKTFGPIIAPLIPILIRLAGIFAKDMSDGIKVVMPYVLEAGKTFAQFADGVMDRVQPIIKELLPQLTQDVKNFQAFWSVAWPIMAQVLEGVWLMIKGAVQVGWSLISGIINIGLDILGGKWGRAWDDMKNMVSGVMNGIDNIVQGETQLLLGILSGFGALAYQFLVVPFQNALGTIGGVFSSISKLISDASAGNWGAIPGDLGGIPHFASGTDSAPGGLALVGEQGPELTYLPRGTRVIPAAQTAQMIGGGYASSGGGSQQPIILQIDGHTFARLFMPYHVAAIRNNVGLRF